MKRLDDLISIAVISLLGLSMARAYTPALSQPEMSDIQLADIMEKNDVKSLDQLIPYLPKEMRSNFVMKHGIKRKGERGHLIEEKVSQSADPSLPRVITWDERNGYSVSYNGGGLGQKAGHRLDILSFDFLNSDFHLKAVDFKDEELNDIYPPKISTTKSCQECHGPNDRPIFSMYPDWPSFYGSDNDEISNRSIETQNKEIDDFVQFRKEQNDHPRYSPLFEGVLPLENYNLSMWDTYPYRQDSSEKAKDISRSFAFRPGLRLGILYNRMNAKFIFKKMREYKDYDQLAGLALHTLLQCDLASSDAELKNTVLSRFSDKTKWRRKDHLQMDYRQLFQLFGLKLNDVDIRYSYNHAGYNNQDAMKNVMAPGYIGKYFNAYFDGTATIDELLIASMIKQLQNTHPELFGDIKFYGLQEKYRHLEARFKYDQAIFENFDRLGVWFPIPYAKEVFEKHHRERWSKAEAAEYQSMCRKVNEYLKQQF
jgi:hypothetical protein